MAQKAARPRRRPRRRKRNLLFLPISFLLICGALFLSMSVFFKVTVVEVEGNSLYTTEEIIAASGVEQGDNLFFVNSLTVGGRIVSRLPYVDKANVDRGLPNRVTIRVEESRAIAYIQVEGEDWLLDQSGKVLGEAEEKKGLIAVQGVTADTPVVGTVISGQLEEGQKLAFLVQLLSGIEARDMQREISQIDMSNIANPIFDYTDRFEVWFGADENVSYKFDMLLATIEQLAAGDTGTIDLSVDNKVHFRYM